MSTKHFYQVKHPFIQRDVRTTITSNTIVVKILCTLDNNNAFKTNNIHTHTHILNNEQRLML